MMATMLSEDPFHRLTDDVEQASVEESGEILAEIDSMSADDLSISSSKTFTV